MSALEAQEEKKVRQVPIQPQSHHKSDCHANLQLRCRELKGNIQGHTVNVHRQNLSNEKSEVLLVLLLIPSILADGCSACRKADFTSQPL